MTELVQQRLFNSLSARSLQEAKPSESTSLVVQINPGQSQFSQQIAPPISDTVASPSPGPVISERVAVYGLKNPPSSRRLAAGSKLIAPSISISSLSDLSAREKKAQSHRDKDRKKHSHRHHHRHGHKHRHRRRSRSTTSSSSDSRSSVSTRKHKRHLSHRSEKSRTTDIVKKTQEPVAKIETSDCGRCGKIRYRDPLDPSFEGLSDRKREHIRLEIIRRILRMKKNNPGEKINLPSRGINDPDTCYRRYVRIARHLYAKRNISTYQLYVFGFTFFVQIGMSIMFGPAAEAYLKREYEQISKYDPIFYEMGCRAYNPRSEPQPPEYRLATQLITPIIIIVVTFLTTKFTPLDPNIVNMFSNFAANYAKNMDTTEFRTLLDDDEVDEPDESDSESEDENKPEVEKSFKSHKTREKKREVIELPDLEEGLPDQMSATGVLQSTVPSLLGMLDSTRPGNEKGLMHTVMSMAQAMMQSQTKKTSPEAKKPAPAMWTE